MRSFEFTIIAHGVDTSDDLFVDRFFEAGCDDALVTVIKGTVALDFTREAKNFSHAVTSAIRDVRAAGARVVRIEPDPYVSISDIAERTGLTRQAISLFASGQRGPGDFPAPRLRVTTDSPLWDWLSVARWLRDHEKHLDREALVAAAISRAINAELQGEDGDAERPKRLSRLLAAA